MQVVCEIFNQISIILIAFPLLDQHKHKQGQTNDIKNSAVDSLVVNFEEGMQFVK